MNDLNLIYILSALFFGMIHALEPGHGKSLITTFILSANSNKKFDAILIGLISSITHTASVYFIGFLGLKFLEIISPIETEIFIGLISSSFIFIIGFYLLWDRIITPLFHHHEHDCSAHKILSKNLKATGILSIGLTAGLVPCSGGLAVFMTATASMGLKNILYGFFYVLSFSVGLGLALTIVALAAMYGKEIINEKLEHSFGNIEKSSAVISAIIIYTLGLVLLTSNIISFNSKEHHAHHHCKHCIHH